MDKQDNSVVGLSFDRTSNSSHHHQSDSSTNPTLSSTSVDTVVTPYQSLSGSPLSVGKSSRTDNEDTFNHEIDAVKSPVYNSIPLSTRASLLPWSSNNRSSLIASGFSSNENMMMFAASENLRPGEVVMRILFADFTQQAEKKIEGVMLENSEKQISKLLQRGEDPQFDQLLLALGSVAEHCLPSLLRALLAWHRRQISDTEFKSDTMKKDIDWNLIGSICDLEMQLQRREAAVEFIFCLALLEVLKQLHFHPGHEDIIKNIENLAFRHFKYRDGIQNSPNSYNIHIISDLYGEVVGTLAQCRFASIRKRFMLELKELRAKEASPHTTQSIISLLMGMKFFRVKMVPIEEFEASFQFMHECAQYFQEVKDKDIKHALAGLFVEILVPVAAAVKNEVNVPCVKNFVDLLYSQTLDACAKTKHRLALFPLVTCLLCVSQKTFFLNNWHYFLAMCLSNLKNRDQKMSRVALESLYRLLWVYMIRIKCESNSATHSRLQSIVNSLFPRGSKAVVPRDMPLNIFVKIIQFIAQERLDFAMREIVFELLWVGRPIKIIMTPERMSIGLRAFLVVADSLQQKDGEPPMPRTVAVLPSGNTLRVKKTYLTKLLTEDMAKSIGMYNYFPHVRRVFVDILRALDINFGRPLMMTNTQNLNKEPDEMLTGERKPKIDLFRTCIAAIPRLIPDNISQTELVDLLARSTVHMDEELSGLAYQSLQTLVKDFPDWRQDVVQGFTQFLSRDINDTFHHLLDNGLRMLHMLLSTWKIALEKLPPAPNIPKAVIVSQPSTGVTSSFTTTTTMGTIGTVISAKDSGYISSQMAHQHSTGTTSTNSSVNSNSGIHPPSSAASAVSGDIARKPEIPISTTLHLVEGFALVMLCNYRPAPRKLAVHILKEAKSIQKLLGIPETEPPLIDVIDKCCPQILDSIVHMLPQSERTAILNANVIDLQWIIERNSSVWSIGYVEESFKSSNVGQGSSLPQNSSGLTSFDPWSACLFGFMERNRVAQQCPTAVGQAWPLCYQRVQSLYTIIDPTPVSDNRASLLRSSAPAKKPLTESQRDSYVNLWNNQIKMAMRLIPPVVPAVTIRCASPDLSLSLHEQSVDTKSLSDSLDNIPSSVFGPEGIVTRFTLPLSHGRKKPRHGSSPDSMNTDRNDKSASGLSSAMYKLLVPLLRCEVVDIRDAAVSALGLINHDALKDLMEELVVFIREAVDRKQENMRRRRRRDALRLQLVKVLKLIAENETFGVSPCVLERDTMSLHPTFVDYMDGARLYLEAEVDKDNISMREVKVHFCDFIRIMIKNFSLDVCNTLLSRDLKRNLFNLFASWSGQYAKPLGVSSSSVANEDEKLQFCALQAMSALLCCGSCFDTQNLGEDGNIYFWLDLLLTSSDDKIYQLAKDTIVLLLECNPDIGTLLEWVIDRCYTAIPREADACFLALSSIFNVKEYPCDHYTSVITVTLVITGCPRVDIQATGLQLLQLLDKRFFGTVGLLQSEREKDDKTGTLDGALDNLYCRSQMYLSRQMSRLRPELTMPIFSEMTHRFQTARTDVRFLLLQCMLPWLENMELLASSVPAAISPLSYIMYYPDSGLKGRRDGSGSTEATEMILNNLFYITAKYSDSHGREIEELWGILAQCWPNNLKVILRYLVIISGLAPNELLCYTKRVALYLARSCAERFLDELMVELQTVETLNCLIERTETPPFYRLTSMRKTSSHCDGAANNDPKVQELAVEKGTIHTKRHAKNDDDKNGTCKSDSALRALTSSSAYRPPRGSDKIRTASGPSILPRHEDVIQNEMDNQSEENSVQMRHEHHRQPHPLPMPEYGGYFAPLNKILPDTNLPISGFHRCNVAVMLLSDIVVDGIAGIDWTLHLPLMLHILFLGLDHSRVIVRDHCKQLLLNLLFVQSIHNDHLTLAKIMLNSQTAKLGLGLAASALSIIAHNFTEFDQEFDSYMFGQTAVLTILTGPHNVASTGGALNETAKSSLENENDENVEIPTIVTEDNSPPQPGPTMTISHVIKSLIMYLTQESSQPLWNYEDITAKVYVCKSTEQLTCFTRHIVKVFSESHPQSSISERWAQTALQLGLSCSSRHYAGRCLQIFRALNVPINSRMLSDILSRLVETVAEQGEDMQGYVTELLLTLEAAVDSLDSDFRPLDVMKDIFKSTPNLNKDGVMPGSNKRASDGIQASPQTMNAIVATGSHARSTSYSVSYCTKKTTNLPTDNKDLRNRTATNIELERSHSKFSPNSLSRSRSAQSLKLLGTDTAIQDDKMTILAQLFWLAVSLLESDYEHEFLLALRLLSRVLHRLPLDRPDARDKVERLQNQLKWSNYPGVHSLLLKGCTHAVTYEPSISLLSQLAPILSLPVCDPTQSSAFAMNVIALLPYMLLHYDNANEVCIQSAETIAQVASEMGAKLENLGTVMTLYSRKQFSKESFQWTKCVIKYLHDTYAHLGINMLAFLIEVLEKGWTQVQLQVLSVIHCLLHYVELSTPQAQIISSDLLRVIAKYLDSPNWREALKILKLVVTRSSTLQVVPQATSFERSTHFFQNLHGSSYSDSEVFCKKELAGRTMEFSFDVSQTPLIGRRLLLKPDLETNVSTQAKISQPSNSNISGTPNSPRRSTSLSPADTAPLSGWKRPWMSQGRVRECLVNLLTTCGQRVGGLPKSPSVIFSQSSDLLERQSSASSTEDTSGAQQDLSGGSKRDDGQPDFGVFKDFDFLEYESESVEGESTDNFNWGVRRRPLSEGDSEPLTKTHSNVNDESVSEKTPTMSKKRRNNPEDSSDEEVESESPLDEDHRPIFTKASFIGGPPTLSLSLRERRPRRDSVSRSDTSGSSAGDLDITPCNASPHLPGILSFRPSNRDETEETWRRSLLCLLVNQPSSHPPHLLNQLHKLIRELTAKCNVISKECVKFFSGTTAPLGNRISILSDLLSSKGEPPRIWYHQSYASTPRLVESLRYSVLEIQEHLETFFDRKEHVMESLESIKSSVKFNLFSDVDAHEGTSSSEPISADPGISEILIDLGRGLYKLMFQLLLLIEADHKIAIQVYQNLQRNETMHDMSESYLSIKGAILQSIDDAELESLDTSTSTEGENTTPIASPLPMNASDFEIAIYELVDKQRWRTTIQHVKQYKQVSDSSVYVISMDSSLDEGKSTDELSIIMNIYAERLAKNRNDAFILSRSEHDLNEIYQILMENLYHVTAAIQELDVNLKTNSSPSFHRGDIVDIITTL